MCPQTAKTQDAWPLFLKTAWKYALFTLWYLDLKIAQEYIICALFKLQYLDNLLSHCFWNQLRYTLCLHYDIGIWKQHRNMLCLWYLDSPQAWGRRCACTQECCLANQAPLSVRGWWEVSIPLISSDITVFALATKLLSCHYCICLSYKTLILQHSMFNTLWSAMIELFLSGLTIMSDPDSSGFEETWIWPPTGALILFPKNTWIRPQTRFCELVHIKFIGTDWLIDDHLYGAILRSFEQTHCARLWF